MWHTLFWCGKQQWYPSLCGSRFPSVSLLLTHIRLEHANHRRFLIQCNLQGCRRTFRKFTVYRNQIYQFHDPLSLNDDSIPETEEDGSSNLHTYVPTPVPTSSILEGKDCEMEVDSCATTEPEAASSLHCAAAKWTQKTRECHRIPQSVMEDIIADVQILFDTGYCFHM